MNYIRDTRRIIMCHLFHDIMAMMMVIIVKIYRMSAMSGIF